MPSFLEFVELLAGDRQLRTALVTDPDATLSTYGLQHLSPADVRDAIALVEDTRTVAWSNTDCSDAYGSGAHAIGDALSFGSGTGTSHGHGFGPVADPVPPVAPRYDADADPPDDTLGPDVDPLDQDGFDPGVGVDPALDDVLRDGTDAAFG